MTQRSTRRAATIAADLNNHSIEERLNAILGQRKLLGQAIHTAAEQLELLTPVAMIPTRSGLHAGPVAMVKNGTVLLVLAQGSLCLTSHWASTASLADDFNDYVQLATDLGASENAGVFLVQHLVHRYGAGPGEPPPDGLDRVDMRPVLGALLAMLLSKDRASLARATEAIRDAGVCPALVAVVGPSSSGAPDTLSFAGPVLLPLARYAAQFVQMADLDDAPAQGTA